MKSKYPSSKPCFSCKSEWKVGDEIYHINDKYWCSNAKCPEPNSLSQEVKVTPQIQKPTGTSGTIEQPIPQAKDFDEMQSKTLRDDGYEKAKRKYALLQGVRDALSGQTESVIGMIFNQICADLRL